MGAEVCPSCSLDDIPREGFMRIWPAGAMECAFMQRLKARLSAAWAPPVLEQICQQWWAPLLPKLFASQKSSFLLSGLTPAGLTVCTWQSIDTIQDIHPPLLWATSLNASMFHYIYSSTSSWQLLCQLFLLLFSGRPLLTKLLPDLYTSFWFLSSVFTACGKSGCSIKGQRYNYVKVLFPPSGRTEWKSPGISVCLLAVPGKYLNAGQY